MSARQGTEQPVYVTIMSSGMDAFAEKIEAQDDFTQEKRVLPKAWSTLPAAAIIDASFSLPLASMHSDASFPYIFRRMAAVSLYRPRGA